MASGKAASSVVLTGRSFLALTGISEVVSFDERDVSLSLGEDGTLLDISGEGLSIVRLSLETGEVDISGRIDAVVYTDERPRKGLLSRLFG